MIIPTVRIKADNEEGYIVINESDYDELEHELFDNKPLETKPRSTVKKKTTTTRKKAVK